MVPFLLSWLTAVFKKTRDSIWLNLAVLYLEEVTFTDLAPIYCEIVVNENFSDPCKISLLQNMHCNIMKTTIKTVTL